MLELPPVPPTQLLEAIQYVGARADAWAVRPVQLYAHVTPPQRRSY